MEKKCGNCGNYDTFYLKAYCEFVRNQYGYCRKMQKVMSQSEGCERWRARQCMPRDIRNSKVIRALEKGLINLQILKQIFTENDEDIGDDE